MSQLMKKESERFDELGTKQCAYRDSEEIPAIGVDAVISAESRSGMSPAGQGNGASRTRTGDLLGAIQALFQLSYSPACVAGKDRPRPLAKARITA